MDSSVGLSMELGSVEALVVPSTSSPAQLEPCQSLPSGGSGGVLGPNSEPIFAKDLSGFLASLEAVSPGYGKDIAFVLAGKASDELFRKLEKSLMKVTIRVKGRKKRVAKKALAVG